MYEITSNLGEVIRRYFLAVTEAYRLAQKDDAELKGIMREGVQNHFNRLMYGGVDVALGAGKANAVVSWSKARHPFTIASHEARGMNPNTLLVNTGNMMRDYTSSAVITGQSIPHGSMIRLRSATMDSADKAHRHHKGGTFVTDFALIGKRSVVLNFPRREFLYWDGLMRHKVETRVQRRIEQAWESGK